MGSRYTFSLLLLLSCSITSAHADSDIFVQSVIMPAWIQHEGKTKPLSVGMALADGDRLTTGSNARVLLRGADGSDIKLGENAILSLSQLSKQRSDPTLFTAFLYVAKGAFRFTTAAVAKLRSRDVTIRVADATIGVRGTDVWGKDGDDKRVVCLIEGKISVSGKDNASFTMDQPHTMYEMPRKQPAQAVLPVSNEKLGKWALETEILPQQGATIANGKWNVTLLTVNDVSKVLYAYNAWRSAGFDVSISPITAANGNIYRLRITHLATRADAKQLALSLKGMLGVEDPTVSH